MGLLANDVFVAALTMRQQPQQIAHGAGGDEQRGGKTQAPGQLGFELIDRRIFAIDVVTRRGACHRLEHGGGRLGDGVAAKIDNAHESGLGKQGKSLSDRDYCGHVDE